MKLLRLQIWPFLINLLYLQLNQILSKHTGQTLAQIEKDTDRDTFMASAQAVAYGLVDSVLAQRQVLSE